MTKRNAGKASLPEIIYETLQHDVLDGTLPPGRVLRQEELARRFDVSRVPLREALARLETEGLITLRPRRGYVVTSLEYADIVEIFELRAVIEEHVGHIAARSRTTDEVAEAERLVDAMDSTAETGSEGFALWSRYNYDFHSCIIASCHRSRLLRVANSLRDSVESYVRVESGITGQVEQASIEHQEILAAFKAGDAMGLSELSREHVQGTARRLLAGLRRAVRKPDSTNRENRNVPRRSSEGVEEGMAL